MVDQSKDAPLTQEGPDKLRRNLHNRHIQLIAIGGAIGTGLFMGSGKTISLAGPSIIFVYMIIGFMLFFVMRAMGELLLSNLEYKSFSDFAADLLGPWAGYFTGWTYWFCWVVTGIADVVAISAYFQLWFPGFSIWMSALLCVVVFLALNIATVKLFGDATIAPLAGPVCEVTTMAKVDLEAGEELDGIGGYTCYGLIDNVEDARRDDVLPIGLTAGARLTHAVGKDQPITNADVTLPPGRLIDELRARQADHFGNA